MRVGWACFYTMSELVVNGINAWLDREKEEDNGRLPQCRFPTNLISGWRKFVEDSRRTVGCMADFNRKISGLALLGLHLDANRRSILRPSWLSAAFCSPAACYLLASSFRPLSDRTDTRCHASGTTELVDYAHRSLKYSRMNEFLRRNSSLEFYTTSQSPQLYSFHGNGVTCRV